MAKYLSYKLAIERINLAIEHEFPLEAIAIEESILTDRLLSFANYHDAKLNPTKSTLGAVSRKVKKLVETSTDNKLIRLIDDVIDWSSNRNAMLHELVKSNQGDGPKILASDFFLFAMEYAKQGKKFANDVSKWVASEIKKNA
jgi:hypothetical protein